MHLVAQCEAVGGRRPRARPREKYTAVHRDGPATHVAKESHTRSWFAARRNTFFTAVHSPPMTPDRPWWQKPVVILAHAYEFQPTIERGRAAIERAVRWKRRNGFDAEHLMVNHSMFEGRGGDDSRAYCFKNFHGYREDYLGEYLPIAGRHRPRVLSPLTNSDSLRVNRSWVPAI